MFLNRVNKFLFLCLSTCSFFLINAQIISTFAGTGVAGYTGDGGQATLAELDGPNGIAVDASGNIYVANQFECSIRKITPAGIIGTFAGTGVSGFSGDGGQASLAQLNGPIGITFDALGNLYVADAGNERVRKITSGGIISTIAGTGTATFSGDGGPATSAGLNIPNGVAVDASGNVYITDDNNNRVRKINTSGIISTFCGNGTAGFSGDGGQATSASINKISGITIDAGGNFYIADNYNNRVRKITPSGIISTYAGNGIGGSTGDGGSATSASLNHPSRLTLDAAGNLYISDDLNYKIRMVTTSGIISTVVGTGVAGFSGDGGNATTAQIKNPAGIAFDLSGDLLIGDWANQRVRKVTGLAMPVPPVTKQVFTIYNSFSPNGDGLNDLFEIDDITEFPKNHVSIFNRYGQLLWNGDNYDNKTVVWDGKDNKKTDMAAGTYFYLIELDGGKTEKHWVELTK
jgi:gliding motility-associated-like protein